MKDAVAIIASVTSRELEVQVSAPPVDTAKLLNATKADSSGVSMVYHGINVHLDAGQLKHQPKAHKIGTRQTKGGNKFKSTYASVQWHTATTFTAVDCPCSICAQGEWWVMFHCYSADSSPMKLGN